MFWIKPGSERRVTGSDGSEHISDDIS